MNQSKIKMTVAVAFAMTSVNVLALPFNSFDPRSMAMGGAGVAVDDPATAPFFNPALLSAADQSKKYSIEMPIIGGRAYDPGELRTKLDTLSTDINTLNTSITAASTSTSPSAYSTVATNITTVNNLLQTLSNQPVQGEFGAATVIGVPGRNYGFAVYADAWAAMGGTLEYNDSTLLSTLSTNINNCTDATYLLTNLAACQSIATQPTLASKIHLRGVLVGEAGLSVSHGFGTEKNAWSLGITPKIMQLQLFDARLDANSGGSGSGVTGNDYLAKYSAFNFDLGAAKSYENGWRTGVVIKNVIPQTYDFKSIASGAASGSAQFTTGTLNMKPQLRTGVSYQNAWSTVAFDIDVTQNDPAGLENKSQYAALGGELSAWGWAQIRAGYRADLLNSERNVASVGLGISPRIPYFKPHLDVAVAGNQNEVGASLRLGFNF